jgi:NAD(P)-dependent dehydrogenase (short-subunit alcohol dehydrogenase family)
VAALITEVLGREITAQRIDPATLGESAAPLRPMFEHYDRTGLRGNALTLRAILGREPRTLRDYFAELATDRDAADMVDVSAKAFEIEVRDAEFISGQTVNVDGGKHML